MCYSIIDSLNVCVGFVNPLTTVTNLQENQEKFHGFSTFRIILLVFFKEFLLSHYHYLTDMVWDTGVPIVVKGTYYTSMYSPYPQTQLARSTEENGKTPH